MLQFVYFSYCLIKKIKTVSLCTLDISQHCFISYVVFCECHFQDYKALVKHDMIKRIYNVFHRFVVMIAVWGVSCCLGFKKKKKSKGVKNTRNISLLVLKWIALNLFIYFLIKTSMIRVKLYILSSEHWPEFCGFSSCFLGGFTYVLGMTKLSDTDFLGSKGGGSSSV